MAVDAPLVIDRDAGDAPVVTVTWIDDTYTDLVLVPGGAPGEWTGVLPPRMRPGLVAGLTVAGLREHETLVLPDMRLLRMEVLEHRLGHRPWWRRWGPWRWRW